MPQYTDQQHWMSRSFRGYRTCTVMDCECGRIHFVSAEGHGDYDEGELERLIRQSVEKPETYVDHYDFDYVESAEIDGRSIVVDCPCQGLQRYIDWIEENAKPLATYLQFYFSHRRETLERELREISDLTAGIAAK